jgi:hypothetical protein
MRFYGTEHEAESGVVASLQHLLALWRAYEGAERFDCLSIGKVARWGQICPQDALSVPQSPFDYEIILHVENGIAIYFTECRLFWL